MRSKHTNSSTRTRTHIPVPETVPEIDGVGFTTKKKYGEAFEAAFLAKAAGFGFGICKPWGDSDRYDFVLDSGHKFWRVQVKSTRRFSGYRYRVRSGASNGHYVYTPDDIDFLVAYVVPHNAWYVVPVSVAVLHPSLGFCPHIEKSDKQRPLEKYREAWCQMACPRREKSASLIEVERRCQAEGKCALR